MVTQLQQVSNDLAGVVKGAEGSIVRVEGRRRLPASGIVWSAAGYIVTANHVVRREEGIEIGLADGSRVTAHVIGRDPTLDLALLQAEDDGDWAVMPTAAPNSLQVGQLALALGRPGRSIQATLGILSAVAGNWRTRAGGMVDQYLQTDVLMYPGFSGGALVNAAGELVGLNTSALAQGVSLTIPATTLSWMVGALDEHGRIRRGYLGVKTQQVKLSVAIVDELARKRGLLLLGVEGGSPADEAGLLVGDILVAVADDVVEDHDDLLAALDGERAGKATKVTVVRGGVVTAVDVTIGIQG